MIVDWLRKRHAIRSNRWSLRGIIIIIIVCIFFWSWHFVDNLPIFYISGPVLFMNVD